VIQLRLEAHVIRVVLFSSLNVAASPLSQHAAPGMLAGQPPTGLLPPSQGLDHLPFSPSPTS
jgi:hypothetical protein